MSHFVSFLVPSHPHFLDQNGAHNVPTLGEELGIHNLVVLICRFLFKQLHPDDPHESQFVPLTEYPQFEGCIYTFNSACSRFYSLSDICGIQGMWREYIRSTSNWRNEDPHQDCVFIRTNPSRNPTENSNSMPSFDVAWVLSFFSFVYDYTAYPCAVVQWFDKIGNRPNDNTGMWRVCPSTLPNWTVHITIVHLDAIYWATHLVSVYGRQPISRNIKPCHSYDAFNMFYVNKYVDHHAFEFAV